MIGGMPAMNFTQGSVSVPIGASLYMFSDGVYEIVDKHGRQWSIEDFVELMVKPPVDGVSEPQRLYDAVCSQAEPSTLDDDFSLVVMEFD